MDWLKNFINSFWPSLKDLFDWAVDSLFTLLEWLLDGFVELFSWVIMTVLDGFLLVIEGFFTALDLSALAFNASAQWASLPPQLIWLINQINFPQGLTLIVTAVGIRMLINLIPAAVTRV